ncbi:hypothetical protein GS601_17875 [Myxacorys almedinensis A]|uniref:Uncharacterized protein n=1 Tax=Myxacorys almedinensis A TaxID=2690445 RepID=A0A8J7Z6U4_9CYAN|nr:hypothetical protein [Myxacorys almedinensis A]
MTIIVTFDSFLKTTAVQRGVSDIELETLSLALNGDSTDQIAKKLDIEPEATRKRLSEVYKKFKILGKGPGKLAKLQSILMTEFQNQPPQEQLSVVSSAIAGNEAITNAAKPTSRRKKVLLLCSGIDGKTLAEHLSNTILKHPSLQTQVVSVDITSDASQTEIAEAASHSADVCVVCITHRGFKRPWLNFEIGFLTARIPHLKLLRLYQADLSGPLAHLASIDGTTRKGLSKLLHDILGGDLREAEDWVSFKASSSNWEKWLSDDLSRAALATAVEADVVVDAGMSLLMDNEYVRNNNCFRQLFLSRLGEMGQQIQSVGSTGSRFSLPADQYPHCLVDLQKNSLNPRVRAVALVDNLEHFWPDESGIEIWETANRLSQRLFVFSKLRDFDQSIGILLRHANKYDVFVMLKDQYLRLIEKFQIPPNLDFSIIETEQDGELLARYDYEMTSKGNQKLIRFCAASVEVNHYKKALKDVFKTAQASQVNLRGTNADSIIQKFDEIRNRLCESLTRSESA